MKKLITVLLMIFLCAGLVFAQGSGMSEGKTKISEEKGKYSSQEITQTRNQFQNRYQFNCTGECTFSGDNESIKLQIREQKRFLFWNVVMEENHNINENGEIAESKYNIWSRLLNRNRLVA